MRKIKPVWNAEKRELSLAGYVVKHMRWPAPNQECVLSAFSKQKWKEQIKDPLPRHRKICAKVRLHDAIKCLNRSRIHPLVEFHGDGTGKGVIMVVRTDELKKVMAKDKKKADRKKSVSKKSTVKKSAVKKSATKKKKVAVAKKKKATGKKKATRKKR